MKYSVRLTNEAKQDIEEIAFYIARNDSLGKAKNLVKKLQAKIKGLSAFPERGAYPEELLLLDIREVREVFYGPYRIFYRVVERVVYVLAVADGRRELQAFLVDRAFRPSD